MVQILFLSVFQSKIINDSLVVYLVRYLYRFVPNSFILNFQKNATKAIIFLICMLCHLMEFYLHRSILGPNLEPSGLQTSNYYGNLVEYFNPGPFGLSRAMFDLDAFDQFLGYNSNPNGHILK